MIEPGLIRIEKRNPFDKQHLRFTRADVAGFEILEKEAMEGDNTWVVTLVTTSGERIPTYEVQSERAAERVRGEIVGAFET